MEKVDFAVLLIRTYKGGLDEVSVYDPRTHFVKVDQSQILGAWYDQARQNCTFLHRWRLVRGVLAMVSYQYRFTGSIEVEDHGDGKDYVYWLEFPVTTSDKEASE
jgi:hypothetical protein